MHRVKYFSISFIAFGILAGSACTVGEGEGQANAPIQSQTSVVIDSDSSKEKALGLIFGMPQIDDRLDASAGDAEDWRYILVPETGQMSISINLDSPGTLQGGWNIYDFNSRTLLSESFSPTQSFYQLNSFPVEKGVYFFKTYAVSGKSIYTIGTQYTANPQVVIAPEPVEEEPVETPTRTRRRSSSSSSSTETRTESKPEPAGAKKVVGFISIITPQNDGSAKITIRNAGTKFGVQTGDVGFIENGRLRIETTDCRPTSCIAVIPEKANPKALKENSNVVFTIK